MPRVVDILVGIMVVGILAGLVYFNQNDRDYSQKIDSARHSLSRMQQEIALQCALEQGDLTNRGYPRMINPQWFVEFGLPTNPLLGDDHPWLEIAGEKQMTLLHPPDLATSDKDVAQFWYNPYRGLVRGRVPANTTDANALAAYNAINSTDLTDLFVVPTD